MQPLSRLRFATACLPMVILISCKDPAESTSTADSAPTGVATVTGRVLSTSGIPLDSFRVAGGVKNGGQAYYSDGVTMVTGADGRFTLRVTRWMFAPPISPDSVIMGLGAQSLKPVDRNPDGSARLENVQTWISFAIPPRAAPTHIVDIIIPGIR